jgi:hypothetical protein
MRDRNNPNAMSDQNAPMPGMDAQGNDRNELLKRLRAIIDEATQSVRSLKEENAALVQYNRQLEDRTTALEQRLRLLTSGITQDEQDLRQSVDRLSQTLQMPVGAAGSPAQPTTTSAPAHAPVTSALPDATPASDASVPATMSEPAARDAAESPATPEMAALSELPAEPVTSGVVPEPAPTTDSGMEPPAVTTGGVYTLITYPFVRFSDLGQFQAALQRLQGVHDVQVRRFAQGTLEMTTRYEGETDLIMALRGLTTEIEEVREEAPYRLRIRLHARTDA